ncbi:DNA repair protein RecO [Mangrovimonas spongiae]|uniref:DNA repair protein RecO n=1 Tax=Mangrovimonas spongiae TaxID=2494697 RepID=A0A3R9MBA0_9FLAO|nr:DNA repair protein RecO [Mangrovimonas spongiae]RSK41679.1 DNA repair protein RecO [Mangrovimonas spongiae]
MQASTRAIVLSKIKYRDSDLIVKCYTETFGTVSYLIRGVFKSRKGHQKAAYFQLLSQLQLEVVHKNTASLQAVRDIKIDHAYSSIHTNVLKSSIVMFLSEILSQVLKEEEKNTTLYGFLEHAILWLDTEHKFSNFHLYFLLKLTKHLGFYPDTTNLSANYFNLEEGEFQDNPNKFAISGDSLTILKSMLGIGFDALNSIKINALQRQDFLKMLIMYYEFHIESFKKPKSLSVLNQVFN